MFLVFLDFNGFQRVYVFVVFLVGPCVSLVSLRSLFWNGCVCVWCVVRAALNAVRKPNKSVRKQLVREQQHCCIYTSDVDEPGVGKEVLGKR